MATSEAAQKNAAAIKARSFFIGCGNASLARKREPAADTNAAAAQLTNAQTSGKPTSMPSARRR